VEIAQIIPKQQCLESESVKSDFKQWCFNLYSDCNSVAALLFGTFIINIRTRQLASFYINAVVTSKKPHNLTNTALLLSENIIFGDIKF